MACVSARDGDCLRPAAQVHELPPNNYFHLRLHRFIHLDQRRPGAFETFAGNFLGRVRFHFFFARRFIVCVAASASRSTGMVSLSLARFAAILLARIRSSESTLSFCRPSGISTQWLISSAKVSKPSIRMTMSKSSAPAPASIGGLKLLGGTYAAPTSCNAREIFVRRGFQTKGPRPA